MSSSNAGPVGYSVGQSNTSSSIGRSTTPSTFQFSPHVPDLLPGRLDDLEILDRWRDQQESKSKLVVVATSGGGIAAAYWTAVCRPASSNFAVFLTHIRIVTGASGGMVGAGYYTATLPSRLLARRSNADLEDKIRNDLALRIV